MMHYSYLTECFEGGVLQIGLAKEGDVCFDIRIAISMQESVLLLIIGGCFLI